jgi:A/G-specific adenine glycosylase
MDLLKPCFEVSPLEAEPAFRRALGEWYEREGKDYPWRRTRQPYPVLVSEIMLQQTQVATVLGKGYYTRFLEKFPDLSRLAEADDESLLKAWEGLGYYRRARMLRETARTIMESHQGIFPETEAGLLALPGIGPYTAAALLAFAFEQRSGLVDGNVSRILARLMDDPASIDSSAAIKKHRQWAFDLCDPTRPSRHHHAMMELGQRICRPGLPACEVCPVAGFCKCSDPSQLPKKKPRAGTTNIEEHALWARDAEGRVLLQMESGKRRNGLWKLPLRAPGKCSGFEKIYEATYAITRYRVALKIFLPTPGEAIPLQAHEQWITLDRLSELPMAAPFRKALDQLLEDF